MIRLFTFKKMYNFLYKLLFRNVVHLLLLQARFEMQPLNGVNFANGLMEWNDKSNFRPQMQRLLSNRVKILQTCSRRALANLTSSPLLFEVFPFLQPFS